MWGKAKVGEGQRGEQGGVRMKGLLGGRRVCGGGGRKVLKWEKARNPFQASR